MAPRHYLSPWEVACQAWLSTFTLYSLLAILKVSLFASTFVRMIQKVKTPAVTLCESLQTAQSQQRYASSYYAELTSAVVSQIYANTNAVTAYLLTCVVVVARAIVGFFVELYLGTLTCLCTAAVRGTFQLVSDVLQDVTAAVQKALDAAVKALNSAISGLESVFQDLENVLNKIKSWFASGSNNISLVSSAIASVSSAVEPLSGISVPTGYIDDLKSLESDVPDFEDVLSNVTSLLTAPLSYVESYLANQTFTLDLPQIANNSETARSVSSDACDAMASNLDTASDAIRKTAKYSIVGLILATVFLGIAAVAYAYVKQHRFKRLLVDLSEEMDPTESGNLIHRYHLGIVSEMTEKLTDDAQWLLGFLTTPHLLQCLKLCLVSWVIVLAEYVIYKQGRSLLKEAAVYSASQSDFKTKLVAEYSGYLNDTQDALADSVTVLNNDVFGQIHNVSTEMLQATTEFQNAVNKTIIAVFGATFLAKPFQTLIYCTIGRKVDKIQNGLEWMLENTVIPAPVLSEAQLVDIFSRSVPENGGFLQDVYEHLASALQQVTDECRQSMKQDIYVAAGLSGVWGFFFVFGVLLMVGRSISESASAAPSQQIGMPMEISKEVEAEYQYPFINPYKMN